ncbi:MAG: hypothetical protein RL653_3292 [Pseudomonadota bacterium]|jgi:hypothetical protein
MSDPLHSRPDASPVPVSYAEKTMASLLQLHTELMEEKERRVELYRRLVEKDEALAELRYQVKILEDRLRRAEGPSQPPPPSASPVVSSPVVTGAATVTTTEAPVAVHREPPPAPAPAASTLVRAGSPPAPRTVNRPSREGWRQW